jgi:hypothetical protein
MAIVFEMWIECKDQKDLDRVADHFDGLQHKLLNGRIITWIADVTDRTGALGVAIASEQLSASGVRTIQDVLETSEAGIRLYHHLKTGPEFRFARVAWEAEIITANELPEYVDALATGEFRLGLECVLVDTLYRNLGSPTYFYPFREGYWWNRYHGEHYYPLFSNDQVALNDLCRQLFPEYFKY